MSTITHLTDATFATTIKASTPVLVDFWVAWCGPCRMVAPVLEQLATDYDGRLRIAKLDVDAYQQVAGAYAVTGIPSIAVPGRRAAHPVCWLHAQARVGGQIAAVPHTRGASLEPGA